MNNILLETPFPFPFRQSEFELVAIHVDIYVVWLPPILFMLYGQ